MKKFAIALILLTCTIGMALCWNPKPMVKTLQIEITKEGAVYVQGELSSYELLINDIAKEMQEISWPDEISDCVVIKAHEQVKLENLERVKRALKLANIKKVNYSTAND
ncbi:MAG: ExbD/TolR family protein [Marinifilaceae bacterium]